MSNRPTRQQSQSNDRWLLGGLVIVLIVAIAGPVLMQRQLNQVTAQLEQQTALLQAVTDQVEQLDQRVAQLDQQVPAGWEEQLAELEGQISDPDRWPSSPTEAQEFFDQTSELVRELPPWAEGMYLPRLNNVRWAAMAFSTLHPGDDLSWEELDATVADLDELVDVAPEGANPELRETIENRADQVADRAYQLARVDAIERAEEVLAEPTDPEELRVSYELLGQYNQDQEGAGTQTLLQQLREQILMHESERQTAAFRDRWTAVQDLKDDHPSLYRQALDSLFSEVATTRTALALEGMTQPHLDELSDELQDSVVEWQTQVAQEDAADRAQAVREYQRWALEQIRAFESAYEDANQRASQQSRIGQTWTDAEYEQVRDAMVTHLLPINLGLLELPVQERYQQAFQQGWTRLDGREEQTFVVEQTAVATKKPLSDFLENEP